MQLDEKEFKSSVTGLNPNNFIGKNYLFEINTYADSNDCLKKSETIKTPKGYEYNQYTLFLAGFDGKYIGDFEIRYLFTRDLKGLFDSFGKDTEAWKGKHVNVTAIKDGEFSRWKISEAV